MNATALISTEKINRVIVIGSNDFINSSSEMRDYSPQVEFIANKYIDSTHIMVFQIKHISLFLK
jgi:hypothetical protein